jgi:hypothetical protein
LRGVRVAHEKARGLCHLCRIISIAFRPALACAAIVPVPVQSDIHMRVEVVRILGLNMLYGH